MKKIKTLLILSTIACIFWQCNPQCESVTGLKISSNNNPVGYEVLIQANPVSTLIGRTIRFGDVVVKDENKEFIPNVGLKVKVPQGVSGQTELIIEDPDCEDFVALDFTVNGSDYYAKNLNYTFPLIPDIIIPTIPSIFPNSIDNAWLNPMNPDYCLWFAMDSTIVDGKKVPKKTIDATNSFEFSTCKVQGALYHVNPVYGVYDPTVTPRLIHIWIDRRNKPNGTIEEFVGTFQDIKSSGNMVASAKLKPDCWPTAADKGHLMVLTSVQTGRQLVVAQPK